MFTESDPSNLPDQPPLDLENPDPKSHLFDTNDTTCKQGDHPPPPQELTLSYLCDNPPKLPLQEKDPPPTTPFLLSLNNSRSKGKETALPDDDHLWVERDFLQLSGGKRETSDSPEFDAAREKKPKIETLSLTLAPPELSLSLDASARPPAPPRRAFSSNTRTTNSDEFAASMSFSCSVPFSHNPSCSLTRNSTENFGENDQMWLAGEGTNGSVHSRFKPIGDGNSIAFANPSGFPPPLPANNNKELNSSNHVYRTNSSDNLSFFPLELPHRPVKGKGNMNSESSRVLREIVSDPVPVVAQILRDFPGESVEAVKECLRNLMGVPEKKDEFVGLQRRLERRSDLTFETLLKSHRLQLEILVTIKTGIVSYLAGRTRIASKELAEIFLQLRCRNVNCKNLLPIDDCNCKICSTKKGFCSACMCPICFNFDCASNTCSWVGCDMCSHWCHAVCGIEKNLIRPAPTQKGGPGMTEMQYQCLGCGHNSEMFGFVKEVFQCCGKDWGLETLMKELDCVNKIFGGSEDFEGKELQRKAEEMRTKLGKKQISPAEACNGMLQFFKYGASDFSVTGSSSKKVVAAQASQQGDTLPLPSPMIITPMKSTLAVKPSSSILDTRIDALKTDMEPPASEDSFQSLETMVKFKEAEAKLFQRLADDAKREVEDYRKVVSAKSEKLEEEYASKVAMLCLQETEERRRRKLVDLKFLENSHCNYHSMKLRMQAEIAGLLERMEATKKQWA